MAKTKLSITLIKDGIGEDEIIQMDIPHLVLSDGHHLYYKAMPSKAPKWIGTFLDGEISDDDVRFQTKGISAVIVYKVRVLPDVERFFAVCFGGGRYLLRSNVVERRFGLLVVLNSVDPEKLRSVDTNSLMGTPRNSRVQSSVLSNIKGFDIDVDSDMLKSVVGKATILGVQTTLSGTDTLSVSVDLNYNELSDFLKSCYQKFMDNHYLQNFDWIDQMQIVKDLSLQEHLDSMMIEKLNQQDTDSLWVSIPEIIDYNIPSSFRMRSGDEYEDVSVVDIVAEYGNQFNTQSIRAKRLFCYSDENRILYSWSIYRCIYAEIDSDGNRYVLNDGKWYKVDENYVNRVDSYYAEANVADLELPDYDKDKESDYNRSVCNAHPEEFCLMDMKFIYLGGSKIEFCDIYTKQKQMVHVKKYNGSAVLSHLFAQGFVSANSLYESDFRHLVNEELSQEFRVPEEEDFHASDYEIVYAIAKRGIENGDKPSIPFFSKVNFMNYSRQLKKFGYKVSVLGIKIP